MPNDATPARTGLSLYANLLDPSKRSDAPGTISSAPVTYKAADSAEDGAAKKQQALAASLRFQPTKRPQVAAQKAKAKANAIATKLAGLSKPPGTQATAQPSAEEVPDESEQTATPPLPQTQKTTAADWVATAEDDEDMNAFFAASKQRGGRKKRKKNKDATQVVQHDWDDIYDPTRPNNYEEYKHSEEKIREVREWKDLLYRHRMQKRRSSDPDSNSDRSVDMQRGKQFAPPPSLSFAPPPMNDSQPPPPADDEPYVPPSAATVTDDASGEDAFARRMRLSGMQIPPPPPDEPLQPPAGQIARAPVRYNLPAPDPEVPANETGLQEMEVDQSEEQEHEAPRTSRPGQAKFAERLMAKYGWSKGQGLGKEGTGITSALYAKADKRKKKSDAEGGGFVTPTATGRIMGGDRSRIAKEAEEGKFGAMSEVVRLEGMLKGMDLEAELNNNEGGIMQEIGEECAEKYGNVERVYLHDELGLESGALVFVHFTQSLSALRAVNALEGRVFNGNEIRARFWDREQFDKGEYE